MTLLNILFSLLGASLLVVFLSCLLYNFKFTWKCISLVDDLCKNGQSFYYKFNSRLIFQLVLVVIVLTQYCFYTYVKYDTMKFITDSCDILIIGSGLSFTLSTYFVQLVCCGILFLYLLSLWALVIEVTIEESLLYLLLNMFLIGLSLSNDLLTFLIFFEGISLIFYILVSTRSRVSNSIRPVRAVIHYLVFGLVGSGFMLFGISVMWGFTGIISFPELLIFFKFMSTMPQNTHLIFYVSLFLIILNIFFKLGVIPFHFWIIPVYASVIDHIFFFLAIFSKPVFFLIFIFKFGGICSLFPKIFWMFGVCGFFAIIFGAVSAIGQYNIKKLVACSAISNIGFTFLILGVSSMLNVGLALFFLIGYSLLVWQFLLHIFTYRSYSNMGTMCENINNLKFCAPVFGNRIRLFDGLTVLSIFSLIGVPPLFGFFLKFEVILYLFIKGSFLFGFGVLLFSIVSSFYYLRLIKQILLGWTVIARFETLLAYVQESSFLLKVLRLLSLLLTISFFCYASDILTCILFIVGNK